MEYLCQPNIPSQLDIPAGVPVSLKIDIETAQRGEQFNHILRCKPRERSCRKTNRLFEQGCCIALYRSPLGGSLPREFGLHFGSDVECDSHWRRHPLCRLRSYPTGPSCCKSRFTKRILN